MEIARELLCVLMTMFNSLSLLSSMAVPFYVPTQTIKGLHFIHLLMDADYYLLSQFHPSECEVLSHWGFDV